MEKNKQKKVILVYVEKKYIIHSPINPPQLSEIKNVESSPKTAPLSEKK